MSLPYSSDNNDELIAEAIREKTLLDLQDNIKSLPKRDLDRRRHPSFSQGLITPKEFTGEVVSPKEFKYDEILELMRSGDPLVFKYQWGFKYTTVNDETKFGSDNEYYNGGNKGYFIESEKTEERSLLVKMTEILLEEKITIVELKVDGGDYDNYMANKNLLDAKGFPFSFVGMAKHYGSGHYDYSSTRMYFHIQVDKSGLAVCLPVGENQQGKTKVL